MTSDAARVRPGWRMWAGLAIGAVCGYLVVRRVEWPAFTEAVARVRPAWLIGSIGASIGAFACVSLRWQRLVNPHVRLSLSDAFEYLMIGNLANLVAPTRLGDLVRVALVARHGGARVSRVLGSLVVERYADVAMLLLLAIGLSVAMSFPAPIKVGIAVFSGAAMLAFGALYFGAGRLPALARAVVSKASPALGTRLSDFLENVVIGMRRAFDAGLISTFALSAAAWALSGLSVVCTVSAFGLFVPWYAGLFVMLVVNLGGAVPTSPGGIGVYHYSAVLALSVWLHDTSSAFGFAVVSHAIGLLLATSLGVFGLVRQGLSLRGVEMAARSVMPRSGPDA